MGSTGGSIRKTTSRHFPWRKYQWRLCVSYQKLKQFTHQFAFPIPLCDYAVQDIDTEAKYFIAVGMYSGYCQVVAEEDVREKLAFFTPDVNRQWKVVPMGALNAAPVFVAMIVKLQIECDIPYMERGLKIVASKIIVYDVLLYGCTSEQIISYFKTVLDVLKRNRDTLKIKNCKLF